MSLRAGLLTSLAAGFTKIAVLDEGSYEWVNRGYPVATGESLGLEES